MADPGLARLLLDAYRTVDAEVAAALEDRGVPGLTAGHAAALLQVDRSGTRLTELARRAGITKQAMMQAVDDLQSRGLVRRVPDPADARAKIVRLTARGLRARAEARRAVSGVEARVRRRLGERRHEALRATLEDLVADEE